MSNNTITTPAAATKKLISQEFAILKQKKQSLTIMILLMICVFGWVIVSVFSSQKESKVDPTLTVLAKPLTPVLDTEVFNTLQGKRSFTDEELASFPIYRIVVDPKTQTETIISIDEPVPTNITN
jgi:hypothetical protein